MKNKHILLGISGGIAAYKSAELTRRLREQGAEVRVVMTAGAQAFITALTLQALSGNPVHSELLDSKAESAFGHIDLARWADYVLIAPATTHMMAKMTIGLADDLLSTLCLATEAPIIVAPAMNRIMWQASATQANVHTLKQRGVHFIGPETGSQACGETGAGRMAEPMDIVAALAQQMQPPCLQDIPILITAGATREDIDPVRFISNRSSGRMGYAMAQAAQEAGAKVTLISGATQLDTPKSVKKIEVYSAADMYDAVLSRVHDTAIFIATAAVADYKPSQQATQKIKKTLNPCRLN
jgi:phosphopantothenoylcysteine decarboxylase/phosphopantothenate--cysteine ligase